jgi:tyrosyl-tRNA synthetase
LDPALTSPYEYFQYWRNVEDAKVAECLAYFTDLPMDEVRALGAHTGAAINQSKLKLAFETTKLLHGEAAAYEAQQSALRLFAGASLDEDASGPEAVLPKQTVIDGLDILDLLKLTGLAPSRAEARRLVTQGGVTINKAVVSDPALRLTVADFAGSQGALVRKGKKAFLWVKLTD